MLILTLDQFKISQHLFDLCPLYCSSICVQPSRIDVRKSVLFNLQLSINITCSMIIHYRVLPTTEFDY